MCPTKIKKHYLFFTVIILSIITTLPAFSAFGGGAGTHQNPYQIWTEKHLYELHDSMMTRGGTWSIMKVFHLMQDIGMHNNNGTDSVKRMIGDGSYDWNGRQAFHGFFYGNNHTISLAINLRNVLPTDWSPGTHAGLFTYTNSAFVNNLTVDGYIRNDINPVVTGFFGIGVGGIVGLAVYSEFVNCVNLADFPGNWVCIGGIARRSAVSRFVNCMNGKNLTAFSYAGGIVGVMCPSSQITHCINIGSVRATGGGGRPAADAGGMVGNIGYPSDGRGTSATNFLITHCINAGFIYGANNTGGIVGSKGHWWTKPININFDGKIEHCLNTGVIAGGDTIGAISTFTHRTTHTNNHYDKQMSSDVINSAEGHLTNAMIGTGLRAKLGEWEWDWVYRDNLYPTLRVHENHPIAKIARSPVYLDDADKQNTISRCFFANIENDVVWSKKFDRVDIIQYNGTKADVLLRKIGNDTLFSGIGAERKTVPIRVVQLLPCRFILILEARPEEAAIGLIGTGEYSENKVATYEVIPAQCYTFQRWTYDGDLSIAPASLELRDSIVMDKHYHLVAIFSRDSFNLVTRAEPAEGGTTSGDGRFDCGELVVYEAVPAECYEFVNWTDSEGTVISEESSLEITVVSDMILTANFELKEYDLTLKTNLDDVEIEAIIIRLKCGITKLEASAIEDWEFVNWTDSEGNEISTENPFDITVMSDTVVIANYKTSSIAENSLISSIKILPNPVYQDAIIEINSIEAQANTTVSILDISGREILTVYTGMLSEGKNNFPLLNNNLASGSYILLVKNKNGQKIERFIIAR